MAERGALPHSTQLLERDCEFDQLVSALRSARDRHGMVVLVSGEAGIGKTTLVRRFLRTLPGDIRALAGSCEDLIAARVLGPFRELLPGTPMANADAAADLLIAQAERAAGGALVAVVDDVQWAARGAYGQRFPSAELAAGRSDFAVADWGRLDASSLARRTPEA